MIKLLVVSLLCVLIVVLREDVFGAPSSLVNAIYCSYDTSVSGEILSSFLEGRRYDAIKAEVLYEYMYDGKYYNGDRVNLSLKTIGSQEFVEKHPAGKKIQVFIDSSNPNCAVLESKGPGFYVYRELIIILLFCMFVFGFGFLGTRSRVK
ncbi:hypothetical protein [Microbulbifer sp. TYP-18]|uniref:DUF3592 domain-containing protein n=1 Tax=Microbulbifer sp. TYP-18 TaxID=3230024 RepID=UPI0034C68993